MCKYNSPYYWESSLARKTDIWQNCFINDNHLDQTLFLNTAVIDYPRRVLENNWACYPDSKSVLGFLQYIYLPSVFYFTLHKAADVMYIPIATTDEFITLLRNSEKPEALRMVQLLEELRNFWVYDEANCRVALSDFCQHFNGIWQCESAILHIGFYTHTSEIAQRIIANYDFPELLVEDSGYTPEFLTKLCEEFYTNPFIKKNFISILNHAIGCVV